MKVCAVTTWPPHRDGIAYYSLKLYSKIGMHINVAVITNRVSDLHKQNRIASSSIKVIRCWKRGSFFLLPQIFRGIAKSRGDVVHVQHGWLLYGNPVVSAFFPLLLLMLRLFSKPVITTVHSVIRRDAVTKSFAENYILKILSTLIVFSITKLIGLISVKIIVHNALMKKYLVKEYYLDPNKIIVIPHGIDRAKIVKNAKPLPESIMFFGHLRPMKGIEYLLQAFRVLLEKNQHAKLLVVGSPHAHDKPDYVDSLQSTVRNLGLSHNIRLESFVSDNRLSELISASQIIVLPYLDDGFIEASGALARMLDYGKPVVCTNIPKFRGEFHNQSRCIMVETKNVTALAKMLNSLLQDARLREEKAKRLKETAKTRYWNFIAKEHVELYKSCFANKRARKTDLL